jgi:hypothetical protein
VRGSCSNWLRVATHVEEELLSTRVKPVLRVSPYMSDDRSIDPSTLIGVAVSAVLLVPLDTIAAAEIQLPAPQKHHHEAQRPFAARRRRVRVVRLVATVCYP